MFSLSFWFSYQAIPFSPWIFKTLGLFSAALVVAGIIAFGYHKATHTLTKEMHQALRRASGLGVVMGIVGLLLIAFVWEGIPFLSMRAMWVLWLAGAIWWGYWIYDMYLKSTKRLHKTQEQLNYEKYLPKPKK